jgi:hypothetical protein
MGLIDYAVEHRIAIICLPAHTTHVLQGLDVVIFSVLKRTWSKHLQQWRDNHHGHIRKENFLEVYGTVHLESFTSKNILASFAATGVEPFNPDVIKVHQISQAQSSQLEVPFQ